MTRGSTCLVALLFVSSLLCAATPSAASEDPQGEFHTTGKQQVDYRIEPLRGPVGTAVRLVASCHYGGQPADEFAFWIGNNGGDVFVRELGTARPDGTFESVLTLDARFAPGSHDVGVYCVERDAVYGNFSTTFIITDGSNPTTTLPRPTSTTASPATTVGTTPTARGAPTSTTPPRVEPAPSTTAATSTAEVPTTTTVPGAAPASLGQPADASVEELGAARPAGSTSSSRSALPAALAAIALMAVAAVLGRLALRHRRSEA